MKPTDKHNPPAPPRKPYTAPVIERYGDIRKITKQVGPVGMNDPGGSSILMTSL
jgi:hypothetical protein